MSTKQSLFGVPYKYVSLITLVVQNSTLVVVMHHSRVMVPKDQQFYASTAVFLAELFKLLISLYMAGRIQIAEKGSLNIYDLYQDLFSNDAWKLLIPAALYTVQNNLQYVAVSLLDAATFSVTYQLKILTTALFSVILLKRSLSGMKWFSLVLLTLGVALVQLPSDNNSTTKGDNESMERFVGLGAVAVACVISGMAGVYFEKVLKGTHASIWTRNIQLSFFSLFTALIMGVWWKDGVNVAEKGFFFGYNMVVWAAIVCQAIGGIIVALVVKYADNILKGFATSISIILSFLASLWIFTDTSISTAFLAGSTLVLAATYIYSLPDSTPIINKDTEKDEEASHRLYVLTQIEDQHDEEDEKGYVYHLNNNGSNGYTKVNQIDLHVEH
ncbi:6780_t:CDS:1 [Ambispora gerdemannii]|uniref:6780_t:CDS:1 n=1 Tax=Ambispora gerdemannii TaxID=144530 RepID=A0A9N8ZSI4_9GLOM|nr:6780_t:CDS:1 [Ambispora gerdemannii]